MTTVTDELLYTTVASPIGELLLVGDRELLRGLYMREGPRPMRIPDSWRRADEPFTEAERELGEYFAGERTEFEIPCAAAGAAFDRRVWAALERIPYGRTVSYGEIAREVEEPGAARAVGVANGRNPIAIVVPCHRVIGADGRLTGYGGGLERKRFLLELEGAMLTL